MPSRAFGEEELIGRRFRSIPIGHRWLLVLAATVALLVGLHYALDAANGPTAPPPLSLPGAAHSLAGAVQSQAHCENALANSLERGRRALDQPAGKALARTIAGVCGALPAQARLQVAAHEVLTITRRQGS